MLLTTTPKMKTRARPWSRTKGKLSGTTRNISTKCILIHWIMLAWSFIRSNHILVHNSFTTYPPRSAVCALLIHRGYRGEVLVQLTSVSGQL